MAWRVAHGTRRTACDERCTAMARGARPTALTTQAAAEPRAADASAESAVALDRCAQALQRDPHGLRPDRRPITRQLQQLRHGFATMPRDREPHRSDRLARR